MVVDEHALARKDALNILNVLRGGTPPPPRLVHHLHVGRERWLAGMAWYLDAAKNDDLSAVRFIVGDYGSGKTHFLYMTAAMAFQHNFVVADVTLTREVRLDRFDSVWRTLTANLLAPDAPDATPGIEGLLNRWCDRVVAADELEQELAALDALEGLDPDFRQALRGYLRAWLTEADRAPILQWLKADAVRPAGIRARIDRASARAMLRSLIRFFKHLGYSGLVLYLDELELLLYQPKPARDGAYEVLRQFIDDADHISSFLILCSITEQPLYVTDRGIPSYTALQQRIGGLIKDFAERDYRALTINLNRVPLKTEELLELAKRIRAIHALALGWEPEERITDDILLQIAQRAAGRGEYRGPRYLVQATVRTLENAEQNRDESIESLLPSEQEVVDLIRTDERRRHEPWRA
jgi:hypothetical protein